MNSPAEIELSLNPEPIELPEPVAEKPVGKPRVWTIFAVWFSGALIGQIASLASFITVGIIMGIMMGVQGIDAQTIQLRVQEAVQRPLPAMLLTLLPFQFGMLLVALLAARWSKQPWKMRLGLMPSTGRMIGTLRLLALAAFTMSTALAAAMGLSLLLDAPAVEPIGASLTEGAWWSIMIASIVLSLVPAIFEEIVFRGYIQRRLLERWSPAMAIGVTTLLFAVIHADSLQHILAVVPLGLVTGLLAWRTGSVKAGMLVHILHNASVAGLAAMLRMLTPMLSDEAMGMVVLGGILVLALIGLPAVISLMWRMPANDMTDSLGAMPMESLAGQPA